MAMVSTAEDAQQSAISYDTAVSCLIRMRNDVNVEIAAARRGALLPDSSGTPVSRIIEVADEIGIQASFVRFDWPSLQEAASNHRVLALLKNNNVVMLMRSKRGAGEIVVWDPLNRSNTAFVVNRENFEHNWDGRALVVAPKRSAAIEVLPSASSWSAPGTRREIPGLEALTDGSGAEIDKQAQEPENNNSCPATQQIPHSDEWAIVQRLAMVPGPATLPTESTPASGSRILRSLRISSLIPACLSIGVIACIGMLVVVGIAAQEIGVHGTPTPGNYPKLKQDPSSQADVRPQLSGPDKSSMQPRAGGATSPISRPSEGSITLQPAQSFALDETRKSARSAGPADPRVARSSRVPVAEAPEGLDPVSSGVQIGPTIARPVTTSTPSELAEQPSQSVGPAVTAAPDEYASNVVSAPTTSSAAEDSTLLARQILQPSNKLAESTVPTLGETASPNLTEAKIGAAGRAEIGPRAAAPDTGSTGAIYGVPPSSYGISATAGMTTAATQSQPPANVAATAPPTRPDGPAITSVASPNPLARSTAAELPAPALPDGATATARLAPTAATPERASTVAPPASVGPPAHPEKEAEPAPAPRATISEQHPNNAAVVEPVPLNPAAPDTAISLRVSTSGHVKLCGEDFPRSIDEAGTAEPFRPLLGVWTGNWGNGVCVGLIVSKIAGDGVAELTYMYRLNGHGGEAPWYKENPVALAGTGGQLSFQDAQNARVVFTLLDEQRLKFSYVRKSGRYSNTILEKER